MNRIRSSLLGALVVGIIVVVPVYLSLLMLLQAMRAVTGLVKPLATLLPAWLPGENVMALLLLLVLCLLAGMIVRTKAGRAIRDRMERSLFERIPGYALVRSLTQRLVGEGRETAWKPALVEIEDALVPAFIIEEFDDGRYTVFVPSVPTPMAGAVYILERGRVHPVDVPFTQAIKVISRWGQGSRELVAAMERDTVHETTKMPPG